MAMRFFVPTGLIVLLFVGALSIPLWSSEPPFQPLNVKSLSEIIISAMSETTKAEQIRKGQDLQYMAKTYYGNIEGWPLVWFFNKDVIPNPENVPVGTKLLIPRLNPNASAEHAKKALEAAFILVYNQYKAIKSFSAGQRRWVLQQAAEAGVNISGGLWLDLVSTDDQGWIKEKKIAINKNAASITVVQLAPKVKEESLKVALTADEQSILTFIEKASKDNKLDDLIGDLEVEATKPEAEIRPEVHIALAFAYGRKGLLQKEYLALSRAEELAKRPDVAFDINLVYGRKKLLESRIDADTFLTGIVLISSEPQGAKVFVDGIEKGVTPYENKSYPAGDHQFEVRAEGYETFKLANSITVGGRLEKSIVLTGVPVDLTIEGLRYTTKIFIDGKEVENQMPMRTTGGRHTITYKDKNFEEQEPVAVSLVSLPEQTITLNPKPAVIDMEIGSNAKGGMLYLDSKLVGELPLAAIKVTSGNHTIRITHENFLTSEGEVDFGLGDGDEKGYLFRQLDYKPFEIPKASILIDGKAGDWDSVVAPLSATYQSSDPSDETGNYITEAKFAKDQYYYYFYLKFSDGDPSFLLSKFPKESNILVGLYPSGTTRRFLWLDKTNGSFGVQYFSSDQQYNNWKSLQSGDSNSVRIGPNFIEGRIPASLYTGLNLKVNWAIEVKIKSPKSGNIFWTPTAVSIAKVTP